MPTSDSRNLIVKPPQSRGTQLPTNMHGTNSQIDLYLGSLVSLICCSFLNLWDLSQNVIKTEFILINNFFCVISQIPFWGMILGLNTQIQNELVITGKLGYTWEIPH